MTPPTHQVHHRGMIMRKLQEKALVLVRDHRYLVGGVMTPPYNRCVIIGAINYNLKGRGFCRGLVVYLTKEVERVVDQLSPGSRMAAAGLAFQSAEAHSALGRECQGSMQTNFGIPGLLQIRA